MSCTVGVVHIPGGILFFKNRDLPGRFRSNAPATWQSTPTLHALQGVNFQSGKPEGLSVGVNRHGVCVANTHIASTDDVTYDLLCERLLNDVQEQKTVRELVQAYMEQHRVQGGRILIAAIDWTMLIEIFQNHFEMQEIAGNFVITNNFSLITCEIQQSAIRKQSSLNRLQEARRMIQAVSNAAALKRMLRSHTPQKGELSICNHRQDGGGTESSHIIQVRAKSIRYASLTGYPCEKNYQTLALFKDEPHAVQEQTA